MLRPRIIPSLLLHEKGLTKTKQFGEKKYVGDPINIVKIFNEKKVDELTIFDIDASRFDKDPDYKLIQNISKESNMPICYGGGIKTLLQAQKIISLGIEKVSLSSAPLDNIQIISEIAKVIGNQSVVCTLDIKYDKKSDNYQLWTHNATIKKDTDIISYIKEIQNQGVGEIIINSIDQDGMMMGYDLNMINFFKQYISVPLSIVGGAGSISHIQSAIDKFGLIGASAGSLFIFKGPYRAVLINYPRKNEIKFEY